MSELPVAEQRIVGRVTGGHVADLTATQAKTILSYQDDLTTYLGNQEPLGGFDYGNGSFPTFYDPASTNWYDKAWFQFQYDPTNDGLDFIIGTGDPATQGNRPVLDFGIAPGHADFGSYHPGSGDSHISFRVGDTGFDSFLEVQATASQTADVFGILGGNGTKIIEATGDNKLGFYDHAPTALQTGVAVSSAGIHAALVTLGLITA